MGLTGGGVSRQIGGMNAAVLSIGTEITRGELINTNAAWLSEELSGLGYEVVEQVTVADDRSQIRRTLDRLLSEVQLIVCTGGLGPTSDDLTSEVVAETLGVNLARDEASLEHIRGRWRHFDREMPASNAKQADFPEGAEILPNAEGTAPGFGVVRDEAHAYFMPGVPREMKRMFRDSVRPAIGPRVKRTQHQEHIRTFGLPESEVAERLQDLEVPGITLGYRASFPEIEVKVLAVAEDLGSAERNAKRVADEVCSRLGDHVYGGRRDTFAGAVGQALRERELKIAVAESCTGGLVGSMLTSVPGSSDYLLFDGVTYSNHAKQVVLGVSHELLRAHGAVSEESARAMAEGARRVVDADLSVAITGVAGPGGGSDEKPVGTVFFAVAQRDGETRLKRMNLRGDRGRIQKLAAYIALKLLWRAARGVER